MPGGHRTWGRRKRAAFAAGLALGAAACANTLPPPSVPVQAGGQLAVQVVDSLNDVGRAPSIAVDQDGNLSVAYILLKQKLKKGDLPAPIVAGQPQPPAVVLATHQNGVWSRVSVTKQSENPIKGAAEGLTFSDGTPAPGLHTALAVDAQGKHHVAWDSAAGLFYSDDTGGSFGDAQKVVPGQTLGVSIAVGSTGGPLLAFYQGSAVRLASQSGTSWTLETVATLRGSGGSAARTTAIGLDQGGAPVVAFGDGQNTMVARRDGGAWTATAASHAGGYGVSLALAADGTAHVAYYDVQGGVHVAAGSGSSWRTADVATTAPARGGGGDDRWSTGIAVDGQGTEALAWADTAKKNIAFAVGEPGQLRAQALPSSIGGTNPALAAGADGRPVAVAWYDSVDTNLDVASPVGGGLAIAFSPPAPAASPTAQPTAKCSPKGAKLQIVASAIHFDTDCLAAPAGRPFTIAFDNQDNGIPHNVAIYKGPGASGPLFQGDVFNGVKTEDYQVKAIPKGTYYFQCDVHGASMSGTFIAG